MEPANWSCEQREKQLQPSALSPDAFKHGWFVQDGTFIATLFAKESWKLRHCDGVEVRLLETLKAICV